MRAEVALLVPQCDRCGRTTDPVWLTHDGLGPVCPLCRVGVGE